MGDFERTPSIRHQFERAFKIMFTKVLFAACALFAVADAGKIFTARWEYSATCNGSATESSKILLDTCYRGTAPSFAYQKITAVGSTYTYVNYDTDQTCTNSTCPNCFTTSGAADTCLAVGDDYGNFLPMATNYLSGAIATQDCTSGTCYTNPTTAPTTAPTPSPTCVDCASSSDDGWWIAMLCILVILLMGTGIGAAIWKYNAPIEKNEDKQPEEEPQPNCFRRINMICN